MLEDLAKLEDNYLAISPVIRGLLAEALREFHEAGTPARRGTSARDIVLVRGAAIAVRG